MRRRRDRLFAPRKSVFRHGLQVGPVTLTCLLIPFLESVMAKNVFAFIGLWVVVATAQELIRKCRRLAESEAD